MSARIVRKLRKKLVNISPFPESGGFEPWKVLTMISSQDHPRFARSGNYGHICSVILDLRSPGLGSGRFTCVHSDRVQFCSIFSSFLVTWILTLAEVQICIWVVRTSRGKQKTANPPGCGTKMRLKIKSKRFSRLIIVDSTKSGKMGIVFLVHRIRLQSMFAPLVVINGPRGEIPDRWAPGKAIRNRFHFERIHSSRLQR
jgi:hypothetical protein